MATTDIYLLEPIECLGNEGERVTVKAGYARNFLLPRKLALPVNRANKKHIEALQKRSQERLVKELDGAKVVAAKLEGLHFAISVKTGDGGKMFGSVSAADLLKRLSEEGVEIEKKQLNLYTPVKSLGKHLTKVKLHSEITVDLDWEVVSSNPIEETGVAVEEEKPAEQSGA